MSRLFFLCLLLLAARAHGAGVVSDTLLQETLVRLDERLAGADPVRALRLVDDVAAATSRTPKQVRRHLLQRLEDLAGLAEADTAAWRGVLALRVESMSRRQAKRYLDRLQQIARRVLRSEEEYLLGTGIRWAAREARVPEEEAEIFARRLVAHGIVDTTTEWAPEPKGLMVSGWTEPYEFSLQPLRIFFDSDDDDFVREAVRDVQRFVVPRVVRRLPASRGVRYAVRDRNVTVLIEPDYDLRVRVLSLRFDGSNANLLPCMDVDLSLVNMQSERPDWQTTLSHCTQTHGSASTDELDAFYEELADLIYARVDEHFETR
jgi:hypothetical protein